MVVYPKRETFFDIMVLCDRPAQRMCILIVFSGGTAVGGPGIRNITIIRILQE